MRVSSLAFRLFLVAVATADLVAEAFTLPRFSSIQRRIPFFKNKIKSNNQLLPNQQLLTNQQPLPNQQYGTRLREQKEEKSFFDYFKFNADPQLRKSLGIQDDDNASDDSDNTMEYNDMPSSPISSSSPHPPEGPPPRLYFSEDTGKPLPNWTPPPDVSVPYDAAARLAYAKSNKRLSYDAFQQQYEAKARADVIRKNRPDVSVPYNAAAQLAYEQEQEQSNKTMSFEAFIQTYQEESVAQVMKKNGASEEQIQAKRKELRQPAKPFLASMSSSQFSKATKAVVDAFVVSLSMI